MASTYLANDDETWTNRLNARYHEVPLTALTDPTLRELATYLDIEIRSLDDDLPANFIGLASLIRLNFGVVECLRHLPWPTARVIREWQTGKFSREAPTIGNLVRALVRLKRLDAATDCRDLIAKDADDHLVRLQGLPIPSCIRESGGWPEYITGYDTPGNPALFDAFVCCSEYDDDNEFIRLMIMKLEDPPYNLRLYFAARDGLFGVSRYETDARVMEERCKHVIIVHTPDYDVCRTAAFQTSIAIYLSTRDQNRRIIPVLINDYPRNNVQSILITRTMTSLSINSDASKWYQLAKSTCRFNFI